MMLAPTPAPTGQQLARWTSNIVPFASTRFPDAVARGLNRTAEEAQTRHQASLFGAFRFRTAQSAEAFRRAIKLHPRERATRYKLTAMLRVEGSGGPSSEARLRRMIYRHEDGGTSEGNFFLPARGLRTSTTNPPRSLYPKNLGIEPRRRIEGGFTRAQQQGKQGAYVVPGVGIFQRLTSDRVSTRRRTADGRSFLATGRNSTRGTRPLWWFKQRITLRPRLRFHETVERVTRDRLSTNVQGFVLRQLEAEVSRASRGRLVGSYAPGVLG